MKTIENEIREAIDRSISHTECVSITLEATICEVMAAIESVTADTEVDYVKNGDIHDVWGWTEATPSNKQDWRLSVTIETNPEDIYLVDVVWGANDPNDAWFDEDENLLSEEAAVERLKNQVSADEEGYVFAVYVYGNEIESGWIVENGKLVRIVNWDLVEYRVNR